MRDKEHPPLSRVIALATRQHGVVAVWQLTRLGFSRSWIARRVEAGLLHPLHRGVYVVGSRRISAKGRWMAAVLACGPDAVLSHRAAAALWLLRPRPAAPVDVTVPGRSRHSRRGVRVHRVRALDERDRAVIDGIPVTSLARTLLDYAEVAPRQQLRLAVEASERLELFDLRAVEELLGRSSGRRGCKALRAVVAELTRFVPWTQSELERAFLAMVREAGLPEPQANKLIDLDLIDFHWPEQRLVVEVDSWKFHRTRKAFEDDRRRDADLQLEGWRVLRFTDRRIQDEPAAVVAAVRRMLAPPAAA